jgi:hypothetical protein
VSRAAAALLVLAGCGGGVLPAQNPSPMMERTRAHERIAESETVPGRRLSLVDVLPQPVHVFVPEGAPARPRLLIHFHGAPYIAEQAVATNGNYVLANVSLGSGSRVYGEPFTDAAVLARLVEAVQRAAGLAELDAIVLSGFSAGYGAIRSILRDPASAARVEGVLLLDGLHTGYLPDRLTLHEGGRLATELLDPFVELARAALAGRSRFLLTHSEIFPGTFASTTETADHLLQELGLARTPVLAWGPVGMQQLSVVRAGSFALLGFAGNSAPDHVDHLHGMPHFLELYDRLPRPAAR